MGFHFDSEPASQLKNLLQGACRLKRMEREEEVGKAVAAS
jgi:hypothetical protein